MPENPLYSDFKPGNLSPEEYKELPRFNAREKLRDSYNWPDVTSLLVEAIIARLNSSASLTKLQWERVTEYIDPIRGLNPNSDEGRETVSHIVDFISTRA